MGSGGLAECSALSVLSSFLQTVLLSPSFLVGDSDLALARSRLRTALRWSW